MPVAKNLPDPQVANPNEPEPAQESEITRTSDILGTREIEVEPVHEAPQRPDEQGFVVIRMSETIEDFTYGNPYMHVKLEEGKRYRVPAHIAGYLDGLGYVWH